MRKWYGSSAVCINKNGELLMVLQGNLDENKNGPSLQAEKKKEKHLKHAA